MESNPFASARSMDELLNTSKNKILRALHDDLKYKKVSFRWVPHELSQKNKEARISIARQMLDILSDKNKHWCNIITGDETWVYWENQYTEQWIPIDSETPNVPKRILKKKKNNDQCIHFNIWHYLNRAPTKRENI